MKKGWGVGQRYSQDPIGSDAPRGKNREKRKHRNDPGLTPTEQHIKNNLMNQFRRTGEGPGGHSEAYRSASIWCECGRHFKVEGHEKCEGCLFREFSANANVDKHGFASLNDWFKKLVGPLKWQDPE